jgi:hypothetical protein
MRINGTVSKKLTVILTLLPIIVFLGLFLYSFKSRETMVWLFARTSYYFLFAMGMIWLIQLGRYITAFEFSPADLLRTHWPGILLALVVTAIVFATVPVQFKILGDETNLLSVSQDMYYHKGAYIISMADFYNGSPHVLDVSIPNRPLLFPFAINLIHAMLGYRPENAFILNFILMFILMAGVYIATRKAIDAPTAVAAIFLVLSYPIISISATSGGYDLFSTLLFALILTVFYRFLKSPDASGLAFLWLSLLMFSNIRYESCVFFLIIFVAALRFSKLSYFKEVAYVYALTPLLSLPFIWQRYLSQGTYENPSHIPLFAVQSFIKHGKIFLQNFLNLNLDLPYAGLLNLAAILIIGYAIKQIVTRKIKLTSVQKYFAILLMVCVAVFMVIVLSHHFGRYDRPTQARLFMYFSFFCALSPIFLKAIHPEWISGKKLMIASVAVFLFYHPIAGNHAFINKMVITRIHQHAQKYLKNLNDPDVLVITAYAAQYTALNFSAVTVQYANLHRQKLFANIKAHRYSKVLVFQEIDAATNRPKWDNQRLDPRYKIKVVKNIQILNDRFLRISRLIR